MSPAFRIRKFRAFVFLFLAEARISTDEKCPEFLKDVCLKDMENRANWLIKVACFPMKNAPLKFFP